jgi:hypothetical protein
VADPYRIKQVTRWIADGTGRSDEEAQFLVISTIVAGMITGAAAVYLGVERFREFLRDI